MAALAEAHVHGACRSTGPRCAGRRRVDLPAYPFRSGSGRRRDTAGRAAAARPGRLAHPLLGAAVSLSGGGGLLLTGRLSLAAQPWLADHVVAGQVLCPGAAFGRTCAGPLARPARRRRGSALDAPLVLPDRGASDPGGRRPADERRPPAGVFPGRGGRGGALDTPRAGSPRLLAPGLFRNARRLGRAAGTPRAVAPGNVPWTAGSRAWLDAVLVPRSRDCGRCGARCEVVRRGGLPEEGAGGQLHLAPGVSRRALHAAGAAGTRRTRPLAVILER